MDFRSLKMREKPHAPTHIIGKKKSNNNNNNNNVNNNNNNNNNDNIQISKRQLHFIRLNHVLLDLNKLSKDTAFMFTFTPFSSIKLTAIKNF